MLRSPRTKAHPVTTPGLPSTSCSKRSERIDRFHQTQINKPPNAASSLLLSLYSKKTQRRIQPTSHPKNVRQSFVLHLKSCFSHCPIYPHLCRVLRNNLRAEDSQSVVHQLQVSHVQYHQTFACSGQYVVPPRPRATFLVAGPFFTKRGTQLYSVCLEPQFRDMMYECCSSLKYIRPFQLLTLSSPEKLKAEVS